MTTDVLALREALEKVLEEHGIVPVEENFHAWRCGHPDRYPNYCHCVPDLLDALIAAVRAETLAGAGVVEVCEQVSEGWPCGQTRDRHDGAYISHPYQPATPPTPVLTAARCGYLIRMLGLTPFICNRDEDDALHRSRTHPDAHAFLATPDPERLLAAIEAQAIGEVEA